MTYQTRYGPASLSTSELSLNWRKRRRSNTVTRGHLKLTLRPAGDVTVTPETLPRNYETADETKLTTGVGVVEALRRLPSVLKK
jgi:hypothetical protein